jgi:hypothetical protein
MCRSYSIADRDTRPRWVSRQCETPRNDHRPRRGPSRLAAESLAQGDPTGWFERLYAEAAAGAAIVPWDQDEPNPLLAEWTARHPPDGAGRRALVVGCGFGRDAEHLAALGFRITV